MARKIEATDILSYEDYARRRKALRQEIVAQKRRRRLEVGPVATLHFESFETMRMQVQEMLHIERGGAEQLPGELEAYNPLVPDGSELVATVLFEIDDPERRAAFLAKLGGVEETAYMEIEGRKIRGRAETECGKVQPAHHSKRNHHAEHQRAERDLRATHHREHQ